MSAAGEIPTARGLGAVLSWSRSNVHFLIALVLVAGTAVGVTAHGWLPKRAVPWPEGVKVSEEFMLLKGLPPRIGPFQVPKGWKDKPLPEDLRKDLGMGHTLDKQRRLQERSNWYLGRVYVDTQASPRSPFAAWNLDVTYYTGDRDPVPHVPEICGRAAGQQILASSSVRLAVDPAALPPEWREHWPALDVRRTHYRAKHPETQQPYEGVRYYVFSVNGAPADSRDAVRLELAKPWVQYCYFAKIQFGPRGALGPNTLEAADEQAEKFLRHVLPAVLKTLPSAAAVQREAEAAGEDN